jgi:glycosyltransferase involved in cell wall biosynthesis
MKLALTTSNGFGPNGFGGGNTIVMGLALNLSSENEVFILAPYFTESVKEQLSIKGIFCIEMDMKFISLLRVFKTFQFDIVLSLTKESFNIGLISLFCSTRLCIYVADPVVKNFNLKSLEGIRNIRYYFGQFFLFLSAKLFAEIVFAISLYTERELLRRWRVPSRKLRVLGCGVTDVFVKTPVSMPDRTIRLLSIGRIEFNQKPINLLVQWISGKQNINIRIVGNGSDISDLINLIEVANINNSIELFSSVVGDAVLTHYDETSCVFILSNVESFWITAYEAVSRGRLVILSDVADVRANLGHLNTVYILENHSVEEFDRALSWVELKLRSKQLFKDLSFSSDFVKGKYNYEIVSRNLLSILKDQ